MEALGHATGLDAIPSSREDAKDAKRDRTLRSLRFPERSRFPLRVFASSREPVSGGDHRVAVACVREPIACRKTAARPQKECARLQKEAVSLSKRRPMYEQRSSRVGSKKLSRRQKGTLSSAERNSFVGVRRSRVSTKKPSRLRGEACVLEWTAWSPEWTLTFREREPRIGNVNHVSGT